MERKYINTTKWKRLNLLCKKTWGFISPIAVSKSKITWKRKELLWQITFILFPTITHRQKMGSFFDALCQIIPSFDSATIPQQLTQQSDCTPIQPLVSANTYQLCASRFITAPSPIFSLWKIKVPNGFECTEEEVGSGRCHCPCKQQQSGHCKYSLMVWSCDFNWKSQDFNLGGTWIRSNRSLGCSVHWGV